MSRRAQASPHGIRTEQERHIAPAPVGATKTSPCASALQPTIPIPSPRGWPTAIAACIRPRHSTQRRCRCRQGPPDLRHVRRHRAVPRVHARTPDRTRSLGWVQRTRAAAHPEKTATVARRRDLTSVRSPAQARAIIPVIHSLILGSATFGSAIFGIRGSTSVLLTFGETFFEFLLRLAEVLGELGRLPRSRTPTTRWRGR